MAALFLLFLCFGLTFSFPYDAVELTDENFEETSGSSDWLVMFHAPWCTHCKRFRPIFDEAALVARGRVRFGRVDCTASTGLKKRFAIKSYPTVLFLRNGNQRKYQGARTVEALLEFVNEVSAPPVTHVKSVEELKEVKQKKQVNFFFVGSEAHQAYSLFFEAARNLQGDTGFVHSTTTLSLPNVQENCVSLLTDGIEDMLCFPFDESILESWVSDNALPILTELSLETFPKIAAAKKQAVLAVFHPEIRKSQTFVDSVFQNAKAMRDKFVFVSVDGIKYESYVAQFGLTPDRLPMIMVVDLKNEVFYVPKKEYGIPPINSPECVILFKF